MERVSNQNQGIVKIKASELIKKFKHKEDRFNFCRQKGKSILFIIFNLIIFIGYWLPDKAGFDTTFFIKFLTKEKQVSNILFIYNLICFII